MEAWKEGGLDRIMASRQERREAGSVAMTSGQMETQGADPRLVERLQEAARNEAGRFSPQADVLVQRIEGLLAPKDIVAYYQSLSGGKKETMKTEGERLAVEVAGYLRAQDEVKLLDLQGKIAAWLRGAGMTEAFAAQQALITVLELRALLGS